jgi:hypothetical protein
VLSDSCRRADVNNLRLASSPLGWLTRFREDLEINWLAIRLLHSALDRDMNGLAELDSDWTNRAARSTLTVLNELRRTGGDFPGSYRNVGSEAPSCAHSCCGHSYRDGGVLTLCDRSENYDASCRNRFTRRGSANESERANYGPSLKWSVGGSRRRTPTRKWQYSSKCEGHH